MSGTSTPEKWEMLPGDVDDPRYDSHGFRRDPARLAAEIEFEAAYAGRLEQQEVRWSRAKLSASSADVLEGSRAELKRLVRQGIPAERRRTVWPQLCRTAELRATCPDGYFESLLAQPAATVPSSPGFAAERQIDLDLLRTFPGHRLLSSADGAAKLRAVLVAYARRDPAVGYVQGMGFVAALLLVFVEDVAIDYGTVASAFTGREPLKKLIAAALDPLDVSHHMVSNHEIEVVDGEPRSRCYFQAQHVRQVDEGSRNYIVAGTYRDRWVKSEAGWRSCARELEVVWTDGNPEVIGV